MKFCDSQFSCCYASRTSPAPPSPFIVEFLVSPFAVPRVHLIPTMPRAMMSNPVKSNLPTGPMSARQKNLRELGLKLKHENSFNCHLEKVVLVYSRKKAGVNDPEVCGDNVSTGHASSFIRGDEAIAEDHQDQQETIVTFTNNHSFVELKRIGVGAFGVVYSCMWALRKVAIKQFEFSSNSHSSDELLFEREIEMLMKTAAHKNIIKMYGYSKDFLPPFLVMELAETCLGKVIHSDEKYNLQEALIWISQCAEGVEYLHSMITPIIHRDLKPQNLLLFEQRKILKICDFGWAREVNAAMSIGRGTVQYVAPEVLQRPDYTIKCDIFSFSMLLFELLHRELPHPGKHNQQVVFRVVTEKLRPTPTTQLSESKAALKEMMQRCWDDDPVERPSMLDVIKGLNWITQHFPSTSTTLQKLTNNYGAFAVGERPDCFLINSTVSPLASELAAELIE